jgi:hypothetical protein
MHWWWFGLSLIGGIVFFLAELYRAQVKKGEPWLGKNWRATLAFYIPMGAGCGWFMFYYGPQVLYRGIVAFIRLYNDPSSPLLKLVPDGSQSWPPLPLCTVPVRHGAAAERLRRPVYAGRVFGHSYSPFVSGLGLQRLLSLLSTSRSSCDDLDRFPPISAVCVYGFTA